MVILACYRKNTPGCLQERYTAWCGVHVDSHQSRASCRVNSCAGGQASLSKAPSSRIWGSLLSVGISGIPFTTNSMFICVPLRHFARMYLCSVTNASQASRMPKGQPGGWGNVVISECGACGCQSTHWFSAVHLAGSNTRACPFADARSLGRGMRGEAILFLLTEILPSCTCKS